MADVIQSGNTATLTFGSSGWAGAVRKITEDEMTREKFETTVLATLKRKKYQPSELSEPGGFAMEFIWNAGTALDEPPIDDVTELITITYPKGGNTTAATHLGNGFVDSFTPPELSNDDLMVAQAHISFEGGAADQPAFSDAT